MADNAKKLYDALTAKGVPLGDYNLYSQKIQDPANRKKLFDVANSSGIPVGDFNRFEYELGGQRQPSQPQTNMQKRFPSTDATSNLISGGVSKMGSNPVSGAIDIGVGGASLIPAMGLDAIGNIPVVGQFAKRGIEGIGSTASNVFWDIPKKAIGQLGGSYGISDKTFGLDNPSQNVKDINESANRLGQMVAPMVASPLVGRGAGVLKEGAKDIGVVAGSSMQKLGKNFEKKAITTPFEAKQGLEVFDREINSALEGNYAPTRSGIQKLQKDLSKLNDQSKAISERSAKQGNTIDFKETKKLLDEEIAKADQSSAYYDETVTAVKDASDRLNRIAEKYPDGQVPINIANELKSSFQNLANGKYDQSLAPSQTHIDMYKKVGRKLLDQIVQQEPALRKIGLQQRNLIELEPVLGRKIASQEKNPIINWQNLRKMGVATGVGAVTGNPFLGAITFGAEQALSNPTMLHYQGVALDRLGTKLNPLKTKP